MLEVQELLSVLAQAGKGLLDMHRSQLVHLDVKENNVLVHWDEDKGRYIGMVWRGRGGRGSGQAGLWEPWLAMPRPLMRDRGCMLRWDY